MKKNYLTIVTICMSLFLSAQSFDFSLSVIGVNENSGNYEVALIGTPNFTETNGNSSDMGAVVSLSNNIYLSPNGFVNDCTFTPPNNTVCEYPIEADQWTATYLDDPSTASGNRYVYQISRSPSGPFVFLDAEDQTEIILAVFEIINTTSGLPTTGDIVLIDNNDAILNGTPNENYFNINYPNATSSSTQDLFNVHDSTANSINFSTLSSNNFGLSNTSVSIYPNPSRGIVNIKSNNTISYSIYNMLGQNVKLNGILESNISKEINLSNLPDGIYILKVIDNNKNSKSFKIIKKN